MKNKDKAKFAWQIHQAQDSWTGKADIKGSILLAADGTVLSSMIVFHLTAPCPLQFIWVVGIACLGLSAALAGLSIKPRISSSPRKDGRDVIYFGHLKDLEPNQLDQELKNMDSSTALTAISHQVIVMSRTNWKKHRLLAASSWFAVTAVALICTVAVFQNF